MPPQAALDCLLEAVFAQLLITLYYAKFNNLLPTISIIGHVEIIGNKVDKFPDGIMIQVTPYQQSRYSGEDTITTVTSSGEFSLLRTFVRLYTLNVLRLPKGYYLKSAMMGSEDVTVKPFKPGSGDLDITLENDAAEVTGSVTDGDHHSVADSLVLLTANPLPFRTERGQILVAQSDQNGEFTFPTVPAGKHLLFAIRDSGNGGQNLDFLRTYGGKPEEIETKAGESKSANLVMTQDGY